MAAVGDPLALRIVAVQKIDDREPLLAALRLHAGAEVEEATMDLFDELLAEGEARGRAETLLEQL